MSSKILFLSPKGIYTLINKKREIYGIKAMLTTAKPLSKRQTIFEILKWYSFSQGNSNKVLGISPTIKLVCPFSMNAYQMGIYAVLDNNALIQFLT